MKSTASCLLPPMHSLQTPIQASYPFETYQAHTELTKRLPYPIPTIQCKEGFLREIQKARKDLEVHLLDIFL